MIFYFNSGNATGLVMLISAVGEIDMDGKKIPFATNESLSKYGTVSDEVKDLVKKYEGKEFSDGENTYKVRYSDDYKKFLFEKVLPNGKIEKFGAEIVAANEADMKKHIKELEKQAEIYKKNAETEAKLAEEKKLADEKKAEKEKYVTEFVGSMSPMQQGKVKTALAKSGNYFGYGVLTRAEFIEKSVAEGKEIATKNTYVEKYRAMGVADAIREAAPSRNREFDIHILVQTIKKNGLTADSKEANYLKNQYPLVYAKVFGDNSVLSYPYVKQEYRVISGDNTYIPITKTEYDYAKFLESKGDLTSINAENAHDTEEAPTDQYAVLDKLGLTYDEKSAIMKQQSSEIYVINEVLNKRETLTEQQKQLVENIDKAFKKFPAFVGTVYRNIGFTGSDAEVRFKDFIKEHTGKDTIQYAGFVSASKAPDGYTVPADYEVHIEIASKNGRDLEKIGLAEEKEVAFGTNTSFAVVSLEVDGNAAYLKLEELENYGTEENNRAFENKGNGRNSERGNSETRDVRLSEEVYSENDILRKGSTGNAQVPERQSDSYGRGNRKDSNRHSGNTTEADGANTSAERVSLRISEETENNPASKTISLKKVGDFYEAYGNDALTLAEKLDLKATYKTVDGEKVQMVGFPINALESYKAKLGKEYGLEVENSKTDSGEEQKGTTDVKAIKKIGSDIRKGENVSLEDMRTAVDSLILNHGESVKAELLQLKNDELKQQLNIYDRGRITKKAEMVDAIYSDMVSNLYFAISGKDTISYQFDGTSFSGQAEKMLFDLSKSFTETSFEKRLSENAEKYEKQHRDREEKIARIKNPQTFEDYAYKKRNFGLSDEETVKYEQLYAEERKRSREENKAVKAKDTSAADNFFSDTVNYTIEKTTHTKTGEDIWVVKPTRRLETEEWKLLNEQMKSLGGSYWRGNQGWNFKKDPTASITTAEEVDTEVTKASTNAEKLRAVADSMQKVIDEKFKDRLTNTAKRAREAASAEAEGERLKRLQDTVNNIAEALENGEKTLLDKIDSKAQVITLMRMLRTGRRNRISETLPDISYSEQLEEQDKPYSYDDAKYAEYPLTKLHENMINEFIRAAEGKTGYKQITERLKKTLKSAKNGYVTVDTQMFADIDKIVQNLSTYRTDFWNDEVAERKRLARMGIENVVELRAYLREFVDYLPKKDAQAERQKSIKAKERQLVNAKIEGFFPTPKPIVEKMLDKADIRPGEKVLEPSAGKGNIADEVKEKYPDNTLDVVEWNVSLNELLSEKGHNVIGTDFLKTSGNYDKIIMNPPFEKGQDIDHIKHAYSLLNDGGRVVCIMSEGPFFRSDKKATEFRKWLNEVGGVSEKLPEGAFKTAERSTGVNTRLVVIDKSFSNEKKLKGVIEKTFKPEIAQKADLISSIKERFGENWADGLAKKIVAIFAKNGNINAFVKLFSDNGQALYEELSNQQNKYSISEIDAEKGEAFSYKKLTSKPDMYITDLDKDNIFDTGGKLYLI